jgi:hypothetical protein
MNLNLQFEITSEADVVLDRKGINPAILMEPDYSLNMQT